MPRRAALLVLVLCCAQAGAQEPPASQPAEPPASQPAPAPLQSTGVQFFSGAVTCRASAFPGGDPQLLGFTLHGRLLESEADVRAFLEGKVPWTKRGREYSEKACSDLRELAAQLRYKMDVKEKVSERGVELDLTLEPVTLVRHIEVSGNLPLLEGLYALTRFDFSPVYRDDIARRLRLQPGASLDTDPVLQLTEERNRVIEYLARRGYFDAQVEVATRAGDDPHEVTLVVRARKGAGYTVGRVAVTGNTAVSANEIVDELEQKVCVFGACLRKDRFSYEELKEDRENIRKIFQKRGYPGVRVNTTFDPATSFDPVSKTVFFGVRIDERKKLTIKFVGNQTKDERTLRDLLTFNDAGAFDDVEALNSAEAIRHAYQLSGRFLTTVDFEREKLEPSAACPGCPAHDEISFHIDEGREQRIRGILFRGNRTFDEEVLRVESGFKTQLFPTFRWAFYSGGYVTSLQLEQDVGRIVEFYRSRGFPDARVAVHVGNDAAVADDLGATAAMITADDPGRGLFLVYDIDEGEGDVVQSLEFRGNHELSAAELVGKKTNIRPGAFFTTAGLDADVEHFRRLYFARGYLGVKIAAERTGKGAQTRVTIRIDEGIRARAGKVIVRGNFKTRRWVIDDVLDVHEGDVLSVDRLEQSQANLRGTELFSTVRAPQLVGQDPVNLVIDVDERHDVRVEGEAGGGFSTDNSIFVALALWLRNLGGVGIAFTAAVELGLQRTRIQGQLTFPQWVMTRALGVPFKTDLVARYVTEDTTRFGELTTRGFSVVLSRQLASDVFFSLRYDWNLFARQTELLRPPGADHDLQRTPIQTITAALGPVLLIDKRRDAAGHKSAFMPSRGWIAQAQLAWASRYLLGTDDFLKLGLAGQLFLPIGQRLVIAQTVRYDQGFPLSGAVLLPEVERFTAGGDTTVRGIEEDRLATEIISNPLAPAGEVESFRVVPVGGNIRFLYKLDAELRVYSFFGGALSIASALFLDNGFITNSFQRFDLQRRLRHSVGIAFLRVLSAAGSASLEYAVPLDPEVGDDPTGRFHLNVGFAF